MMTTIHLRYQPRTRKHLIAALLSTLTTCVATSTYVYFPADVFGIPPSTNFVGVLSTQTGYESNPLSANIPILTTIYLDYAFGWNTTLTTGIGWDNATGYGEPNGLNFINAAAKFAR